jgi:hypothetical protein
MNIRICVKEHMTPSWNANPLSFMRPEYAVKWLGLNPTNIDIERALCACFNGGYHYATSTHTIDPLETDKDKE